uniref:EamA domain-containing protein n=1 Tax=Corethron hystrix TaxID=216773 RepID=A0A7S1BR76_9STRA|mmetsp:Transcript_38084/g.88628  ORF Transcript_38084/g.88628 Transcript_38084/m.88628 type:complete len:386 (+) Transcript_38084:330-1487(+)
MSKSCPAKRPSTGNDLFTSLSIEIDTNFDSPKKTPQITNPPLSAAVSDQRLSPIAICAMGGLAIQFGMQPILIQSYVNSGVSPATLISCQEAAKLGLALFMLRRSGPEEFESSTKGWNLATSFRVAGLPAIIYAVQGYCFLIAYKNLDPVSFNVINQTKTLAAALFCFLLMGKRQSNVQLLALVLLLLASLVIEGIIDLGAVVASQDFTNDSVDELEGNNIIDQDQNYSLGLTMILTGCLLSGLAGALAQKSLQIMGGGRNSFLFTAELSLFSAGCLILSLVFTGDIVGVLQHGFFHDWTLKTLLPIFSQAFGGVCIGLVTKHAGAVMKGFALVIGLVLTGLFQSIKKGEALTLNELFGVILVSIATTLHLRYPYKPSISQIPNI